MDSFEALGGFLRSKREEKNLSIEEAGEKLCLRTPIIEEIESGKAHNTIPPVYLFGYIRQYSRLLGCEEEISSFLSELKKRTWEGIKSDTPRAEIEKRSIRFSPYFILPMIIAGIVVFFFAEKKMGEKRIPPREEAKIETTSVSEVPPLIEKKLLITCHERTWISVIVDGKEKKEFMLNPKDVLVLNAKEGFDLLIGNAGGIKLFLNGKDLGFSGKSGEVKRLKIE